MAGGLSIEAKVKGEEKLAEVNRIIDGLEGVNINPVFGRAAVNVTREHLFKRNATHANRLGGARTNFYAGAARGTQFEVRPDGFVLGIDQVGIRQRYQGGTITPKQAKYLTIPMSAAAHGKRAREFSDLKFAIVPGVGRALVRGDEVMYRLSKGVTQKADDSVLPSKEQFINAMVIAGSGYAKRLIARKGQPQ